MPARRFTDFHGQNAQGPALAPRRRPSARRELSAVRILVWTTMQWMRRHLIRQEESEATRTAAVSEHQRHDTASLLAADGEGSTPKTPAGLCRRQRSRRW